MKEKSCNSQCRLCTSTTVGQIIEIFGENGKTRNLAKKIEECLPISVTRGDTFPKTVCLICLDKLEQFYDFREGCIKSELCFEAKWKELHPHQNIQFPLEPECCLQEEENECAPVDAPVPPATKHPTPEGLFRLEIIPQYNVPNKPEADLGNPNVSPILPNHTLATGNNQPKTSTPLHTPNKNPKIHVNSASNQNVPKNVLTHPQIGLPNPDDYILMKEEIISLSNDATKNSNNLIEFYNTDLKNGNIGPELIGKDLDIILEQKRRHEILPPMWDVYEKVITLNADEKLCNAVATNEREGIESVVNPSKCLSLVDSNENSISERECASPRESAKDATDSKGDVEAPSEDGKISKDTSQSDESTAVAVAPAVGTIPTEGSKVSSKTKPDGEVADATEKCSLKVVHRRYIISKEAFPCSLCGSCFLVNQGFERETFSNGFHRNSSYENDINFLNNTPEDRKLYNFERVQNNQSVWPALEISKKCSPPVVTTTKNKPNIALTSKKNGPNAFEFSKKPLNLSVLKKVQPAGPSPPKSSDPEVLQTTVNTKHQFVSQVIKREPIPNEEGVSVTSEDIDDFNSLVIKNFYCEICNKYFPRRSSLKRHQRTHASDKVFSCTRCSKAFSRKEHLARHMLLHNEVRPFQCQVCFKKYTRKEHVERHILIHPQVPELEFRTRKFDKQQEKLYRELESESLNGEAQGLKIPIFKGRGTGRLERPYLCELCNHGFARREHLQRHKKRMHRVSTGKDGSDDSKPYSCPKCLKTFTRKEHLVRHNKIHLREIVLRTGIIPGMNLLPAMLQLPPKSQLSDSKGTLLNSRLPELSIIQTPKLSCDRLPGLDVSLSVVEPNTSSKSSVPKEIPLIPNKLDISISLVQETTPKPSTSNGVTQVKHDSIPKSVDLLSSINSIPEDLSRSLPVPNVNHLGSSEEHLMNFLKPFNCEYCFNKRFTRKSHLVRHFKRIHPDRDVSLVTGSPCELKPDPIEFDADTFVSNNDEHLCKICNKNFSRRYHLNRHLKLHILDKSGKLKEIEDDANKPFKCSSCNERFSKYEGFQTHRCTGTEVGSMVLVGNTEMAGGSETGSTASSAAEDAKPSRGNTNSRKENLGKVPNKSKNESTKPSLVSRSAAIGKTTSKRKLSGATPCVQPSGSDATSKNPAKRDRRKLSRNCYECEVCGDNFALKKLVNKHMLTHEIDVNHDTDNDGGEGKS